MNYINYVCEAVTNFNEIHYEEAKGTFIDGQYDETVSGKCKYHRGKPPGSETRSAGPPLCSPSLIGEAL